MKTLRKRSWIAALGLVLLSLPLAMAHAQDEAAPEAQAAVNKPVAVVSVAPVSKVIRDVQFLATAADQADLGRMVAIMSAPFTQGVDKTKPIGAVVMTNGQDFQPVGFIPVTDFDSVMLLIKEQYGPPQDVGDGVKLLGTPIPLFVKEIEGWAIVSGDKDNLGILPADPSTLLGEMPNDYDLAVTVLPGNVPELYREILVEQMRAGVELSLEQEAEETDEEFAARKEMLAKQIEEVKRVFEETEEITVAWNVDSEGGITYLDMLLNPVAGSKMAQQLEMNRNQASDYAGFHKKGAAFSMLVTSKSDPAEIEPQIPQLQAIRDQAIVEATKEADDEEAKQAITTAIELAFDTLIETARTGRFDMGAHLDLADEKMTFLLGAFVADGNRVEDGFKELAEIAKENPDFPGVNWNAETHQAVRFHTMSIPTDKADDKAKKVLGEKLDVVLGVAEQGAYLAIGDQATTKLKAAIDKSAASAGQPVNSSTMVFSVKTILQYIDFVDPQPALKSAIAALTEETDKISITSEVNEKGARVRLQLQDDVIKAAAIGAAAANNNPNNAGPEVDVQDF
ncbi:MAG: hypothetical protein WDZ51_00090 [Pirellulaceae bacterium]